MPFPCLIPLYHGGTVFRMPVSINASETEFSIPVGSGFAQADFTISNSTGIYNFDVTFGGPGSLGLGTGRYIQVGRPENYEFMASDQTASVAGSAFGVWLNSGAWRVTRSSIGITNGSMTLTIRHKTTLATVSTTNVTFSAAVQDGSN